MKKGHPPSLLSPETDGKLVRKPSNNIPKIILMIDDPVIDTPSSLAISRLSLGKGYGPSVSTFSGFTSFKNSYNFAEVCG